MEMHRNKVTTAFLVIAMVLGSATNSAALTAFCAPKACCCSAARASDMHHGGHALMQAARNCDPLKPVANCHLKTVQPKVDLAISARTNISALHAVMMSALSEDELPAAQQFATRPSIFEDERIRAPLVPIYLLTLTIRC